MKNKTLEFKQNDLKRNIPFAIIYCITVFVICYSYFGGLIGMANALNHLGSAKAAGLLVGLAILAPFFIILRLIMPKVKIDFFSEKIIITNKQTKKEIAYQEIHAMQLNITNFNRLDILGQRNEILFHIQPQNQPEILAQIIGEIAKHVAFVKQQGSKKYFTTNVPTAIYVRKDELLGAEHLSTF